MRAALFRTTINFIDRQILSLLKPILDEELHWSSTQFGAINSAITNCESGWAPNSGLGNKGASPETSIKAEKTVRIAGSFTLVPLEDAWPAALTRWFGKPAAARDVFRPFHHSYDQ